MAATFARLASQAYHTSSKALMTTHGRTCGHCCRQTALNSLPTKPCNWEMKRYFSKTGITMDEDGIDRSRFTRETEIEMPDIGDDTDCVIEKWHKKEGDLIKRDDVICDIRTKLLTFGMITDDDYDSIMGKICIPEESDPIKPGTVICITLDEGLDEEVDTDADEK